MEVSKWFKSVKRAVIFLIFHCNGLIHGAEKNWGAMITNSNSKKATSGSDPL